MAERNQVPRLLLRLHFRAPGVQPARNQLGAAVRERFDVPAGVELRQVRSHWLNVNPTDELAADVFDWLAGVLTDNTINAYPTDERSRTHPAVERFLSASGFTATGFTGVHR